MEKPRIFSITGGLVVTEPVGPVGIVCHDAGGANQILAMSAASGFAGASGYFEGPARALWLKVLSGCKLAGSLQELLAGTRTLVTGTGWGSRLEHDARDAARRLGIRSIAVLDHWTNYGERFVRDEMTVLPDELWVVDEYALSIARRTFPGLKIVLQPDCYAEQQARGIAPLSAASDELLYLLEPARSDWGRGEPGEFQALRYFFDHLVHLGLADGVTIRLRPHPSDPPGKYDAFLGSHGTHQVVMAGGELVDALSRARWVAGCETYALTLALRADRTVYCALPPWAPPCRLPHHGFVHVKELVRP